MGRAKYAPGSIASFFTIVLGYFLLTYFSLIHFIIFILLSIPISFACIRNYLKINNKNDPKEIVIDEFVGQLVSLMAIPLFNIEMNFISLFIAFVSFRFFDISKIGIKKIEKMPGAWGVLLDDIIAGIYSCIVQFIFWKLLIL